MKEYKTISIVKISVGLSIGTLEELKEESKQGWEIVSVQDNYILLSREIKKTKSNDNRGKTKIS